MQLKSLIATLVLASSSIAAASPTVRDHRTPNTTTVVVSGRANGGVTVTPAAPVVVTPTPVIVPAPAPQPIVVTTTTSTTQAPVPPTRRWLEARGELHIGVKDIKPIYRPVPAPQWITLLNNASIKGRTTIDLNNTKRLFTKLELRAEGTGRIDIDRVMIQFGNGQRQIVNIDRKLSKQSPTLAIDLKGETRAIDKIVIVGKTSGRAASLDVLAL